jgi:hypothetical protein
MNYTTLKSGVADYLHRDNLTSQIPGFIELAESYLFRELNVQELQVSVAGTTIAGGYGTLPTDFGSVSKITVTNGSWTTNLDYMDVADVPSTVSTHPQYYSLENNQIRIIGAGVGQAYTLFYTPKILPLSASVATNWILDNASELYLYASCLEAARYLRDAGEIATLSQSVTLALESARRFAERRGQPSSGSLQIRPRRG